MLKTRELVAGTLRNLSMSNVSILSSLLCFAILAFSCKRIPSSFDVKKLICDSHYIPFLTYIQENDGELLREGTLPPVSELLQEALEQLPSAAPTVSKGSTISSQAKTIQRSLEHVSVFLRNLSSGETATRFAIVK